MIVLAQRWWPVPAMLAASLAAQVAVLGGYDSQGHAAAHLASASSVFAYAFAVGVLVWALDAPQRRRPALWLLGAAVVLTGLAETVGNLRIVDAIGGRDWTDDQAGALGPGLPGFESGHDLAGVAGLALKVAAGLLALWLLHSQGVRRGAAIAALVLSVLMPPWFFAGIGVFVLALAAAVGRARRGHPKGSERASGRPALAAITNR